MRSSACSTTSLHIMGWLRRQYTCTPTTGGQNKNVIVVQYLWKVMAGQHKQITQSFMIPSHTKFSLDWCFGLFKK